MNLFYAPGLKGDVYDLPESESKHLIRVLRLNQGDEIKLTDGQGAMYTAQIMDPNPKKCRLLIVGKETDYEKRDYVLSIAIAPTKNIDRFEWFLEKCTEIGIDNIYPFISERSERKTIKPDRLNRVITAAMKQSLKAYHPVLHPLSKLEDILTRDQHKNKFIAHCGNSSRELLHKTAGPGGESIILIGPEGDFTPVEIEIAENHGFVPVSLGNSRLRTETAGVTACHTISIINL